jgi:hypothetical protein
MTLDQIGAIASPADGLMAFSTTDGKLYIYVSTSLLWKEVTFGAGTISPPFVCGSTVTVNHATGVVAPVSKTVAYGTVTNIPGEPTKCWITSNLGADHQATAVSDATEASAGWYWQFNHKQGYKHDGSTRTPGTSWIAPISENSDWIAANDPCTLELGSDWRIPTSTEWTNVDAGGSWTNSNGPWSSDLKMHNAGKLYIDGGLTFRGVLGYYWSSAKSSETFGFYFIFGIGGSSIDSNDKSQGFSLRCLKE